MANSYEYGPFGQVVAKVENVSNPYQFNTKMVDSETGLSYYGFRFYDADNGRWLNRDPAGAYGGINLYNSVSNNMVNGFSGGMTRKNGMDYTVGKLVESSNVDGWGNWRIVFDYNSSHEKLLNEALWSIRKKVNSAHSGGNGVQRYATKGLSDSFLDDWQKRGIDGVRWNDIPEGLTKLIIKEVPLWVYASPATFPLVFLRPGEDDLTTRTHYGDLQYIHAMTGEDGPWVLINEKRFPNFVVHRKMAADFREQILVTGQNSITKMIDKGLFTTRSGRKVRKKCPDLLYIGKALHTIQDSYSAAHVFRVNGKIKQYQNYKLQDSGKHKGADRNTNDGTYALAQKATNKIIEEVYNKKWKTHQFIEYLRKEVFVHDGNIIFGGTNSQFEKK